MENKDGKLTEMCRKAEERIKNGSFMKTLHEETPGVNKFIEFLHKKQFHAKRTKRRDIPMS